MLSPDVQVRVEQLDCQPKLIQTPLAPSSQVLIEFLWGTLIAQSPRCKTANSPSLLFRHVLQLPSCLLTRHEWSPSATAHTSGSGGAGGVAPTATTAVHVESAAAVRAAQWMESDGELPVWRRKMSNQFKPVYKFSTAHSLAKTPFATQLLGACFEHF